jgi:dTDP-4-amino-4,6-dideoxygalactose transaminase
MRELGFNYRITDFQCALGLSQLKKIDKNIQKRQQIAAAYDEAFGPWEKWLELPAQQIKEAKHARHLYLLRIKTNKASTVRKALYEHLRVNGILAQVHYIPVYKQPFYKKLLSEEKINCPNAEKYYKGTLSLPLFPTLSEEDMQKTIDAVNQFFTDLDEPRLKQASTASLVIAKRGA